MKPLTLFPRNTFFLRNAGSPHNAIIPKKTLFCLALAMFPGAAFAEFDIAQQPLIVDKQVEPNVVYIFDDSASMDSTYMPDNASGPSQLQKAPAWNRQYYSPDITYQPPYRWESGRLVSMGSGLVSINLSQSSFTVKNNVYATSPNTVTFSTLAGTGEGTVNGNAAALYYDYVPGFYSMRDNPDFNPAIPVEADPHNYEYWAFRTGQAGEYFLKSGNARGTPGNRVYGNRTAAQNETMVEYRACPNLFQGTTESAEYHESLGNTITFNSSNAYLSKFNGLAKGIPHAQCVISYRVWDVDIPGTHQNYNRQTSWYAAWAGIPGSPSNNPRLMGLPVGRPWCNKTNGFGTTIPATNTATSNATPWTAISNVSLTGTAHGTVSNRHCYAGRHRIGDTNGDGRIGPDLDAPVSHFEYRGEHFIGTCKADGDSSNDGICYGLNGPEQSRPHLVNRFVTPEGDIRIEDVPRRRTGREEIENFANWFAYYRTRAMAARAGTSLAFAQMVDKNNTTQPGRTMHGRYVRLGYDTINRLTGNTVGLGRGSGSSYSNVSSSGVLPFRDFPANATIPDSDQPHPYAGKNFVKDFYNWILRLPISGTTPLRRSLSFTGQYYQTAQPWTEYPPLPGASASTPGKNISNNGNPYACRRAFAILMTDGYENGGAPSPGVGAASCSPQPKVDYRDARGNVIRSTYDPASGITRPEYDFFNAANYAAAIPQGPFCGENLSRFGGSGNYSESQNLADVAAYYWQRDLQPDIPNQVPATKKSNAFWQHMQTFTIGLGVVGRMSDKEVNEFLKDPARVKDKNIFWQFPTGLDTDYERIDDLMHAGLNGRGGTAAAQDPGEFVSKLSQLLGEIAGEVSTVTGYQTPAGELAQTSVRTFYNNDGPWTGNVEGFNVEFCTRKKIKAGLCKDEGALLTKQEWSASEILRSRINTQGFQSRRIFTWDGANGIRFDSNLPGDIKSAIDIGIDRGNSSGKLDACPFPRSNIDAPCLLKNTTPYRVELLLDYLAGDSRFEDNAIVFAGIAYNGFRDRTGTRGKNYLMDFINSTPYQLGVAGKAVDKNVFAGHFDFGFSGWKCGIDGPADPNELQCGKRSFLTAQQIREYDARLIRKFEKFANGDLGVVYVGGNSGMLHAFGVGGSNAGEELFAFIPAAVHGKLKHLADPTYDSRHTYTVDGSPFASDILLGGEWRSVVVGSTGRGGKSFFALDVEEPESFAENNVLWEFTHDDLGVPAGGEPVIQPVSGMPGNWAVTFGNGYNSKNHRAVLFVVQLAKSGTPVFYALNTGEGNAGNPNGLGTPLLMSLNVDGGGGLADIAYAGDALGNLWKFDLRPGRIGSGSAVEKILSATAPDGSPQPITAPPGFSLKAAADNVMQIIVGTGKHFEKADLINKQVQSIYGVRDFAPEAIMGTATRSRLLNRAYIGDEGAMDNFIEFDGTDNPLPGWKLANEPDVEYDNTSGQMGYVIDLNAADMNGWRIGVQGTEFANNNYLAPAKIPLDDPCLDRDAGAIAEIEPIHGKWIRSRLWKEVKGGSNIWRDDRTQGLEINRDDKKGLSNQRNTLYDAAAAHGESVFAYKPNFYDNPRFGILGEKLPNPPECQTVFNPGTEKGTIICVGRSGRQSWRQLR
ncbi:MAG: PilC/PilY family type IV pilus protein [Betaproteobacteria bacterium]|nr:PilC/PilY family type IV pilus protein [Betaproteobacteria bacterium]